MWVVGNDAVNANIEEIREEVFAADISKGSAWTCDLFTGGALEITVGRHDVARKAQWR